MFRFDRVLIDPSPDALARALAEAATAANTGCRARLVDERPADFPGFLATWRAAPEGQRQWDGPGKHRKNGIGGDMRSAMAIVWWSDPIGRKHSRIVSDRVYCGCRPESDLLQPNAGDVKDWGTPPRATKAPAALTARLSRAA